jgi:serine/threonine-protein kinase
VAPATKESATQVIRAPAPPPVVESTAATMIAPSPTRRRGRDAPPVVAEEEYEERRGGAQERPLWPWLVAVAFVIAAVIAGFFVWQELSGSTVKEPVALYRGERVASAEAQIRAAHLVPSVKHGSSKTYRPGIVFKQDPDAGSKVDKGGTVTIWVSTGPPKVQVPDVKGEQWAQAQADLQKAGLKPLKFGVPGNTTGKVTATDPPAGASVPEGSKVRVNVMNGPVMASVPNVVNETVSQATAALNAAGFNYKLTYVQSDATQNEVVHQNPAGGSSAPKGMTVQLQVSSGPPMVQVPTVVGEQAGQAIKDLQRAGFIVTQQYVTVSDPTQNGLVQQQSPDGGSQATKGSTVTITVAQYSPAGTTTGTG